MLSTNWSRPFTIKRFAASLGFVIACSPLVSSAQQYTPEAGAAGAQALVKAANAEPGSADAVAGAAVYAAKACIACHGIQGRKTLNNEVPVIAGQNRNYLVMQLTDIRSGARSSGNTVQMKGIAQTLTDQDIELIADFLSSQVITYSD